VGLGERREIPSGMRGGTLAANALLAYLRPTDTSGRENSVTLLNNVQSPKSDIFIWKWCIK